MFLSLKCSSSGGYSCIHAAYGTVTLYVSSWWPVGTKLEWDSSYVPDYYLFIKYYSPLHVSSLKCSSLGGYSFAQHKVLPLSMRVLGGLSVHSVMNECNECRLPKIVKIRYISYTLNLFKTIAIALPTRAVTVNFLQFVTLALVLSTRQCRHSSLYYQECNELLIIFYIIDVTSHTLSLFGQTILDEVANRLSIYQRRRRTYILHCVSQRVYEIIRRKTMFVCLLCFQVMNCWMLLEFASINLETLVEYIF